MAAAWTPKNWEEVCKRNAGRRKFHMRKREARAIRICRLLGAMESAPELRESAYGWLAVASQVMGMSKATASRDFALVRRIHSQFARMFGRPLNTKTDQLLWSWDWSHYGFISPESVRAGHRKAVGKFPFSLRETVSEESFCGLSPLSFVKSQPSGSEVLSLLKLAFRAQRLSQRLRG